MNKRKLLIFITAFFCLLSFVAAAIVLYISSPLHPKNITDETVLEKGAEYTVRLSGVSDYNENGFMLVTEGFYLTGGKDFVYKDEEGFAYTSVDGKGECCVLGEYSSFFVDYGNYKFCGEKYKSRQELEFFFEEPDRIYDFDINKLSEYIQDVIHYKKHFYGRATVKIYKGRLVVDDIYIGEEKVLVYKKY